MYRNVPLTEARGNMAKGHVIPAEGHVIPLPE
jgi:hypothetical protein